MIRVDIGKCTGCKRCETVCAFFHTGRISNRLARIKVLNLYNTGIDAPIVCVQCSERYCMQCPSNALTIGRFGQVIASPTLCTNCGTCEKNCPIGAIELFNDLVYVCDFCGGEPKCIEACTEGAITRDDQEVEHTSLSVYIQETKEMNPSQKRHVYLSALSSDLRNKWRKKRA
ncbi:MAG: 4Fe-4S dicluster domain-containing protein [Candidatus Hydrogenedentota bacterium]|nr:MAG: 4Fe-4S dicluster domain-containing protein [Candidatus Hydrogenedentota bacterium]